MLVSLSPRSALPSGQAAAASPSLCPCMAHTQPLLLQLPRWFWGRGRGQGHLPDSKHKSFTISPNVTRCHGFVPGLEFLSNVKHTEIQTEGAPRAEGSHSCVSLLFGFYFHVGAFLKTACICSGTSAFQESHLHVLNLLSRDSEGKRGHRTAPALP